MKDIRLLIGWVVIALICIFLAATLLANIGIPFLTVFVIVILIMIIISDVEEN